MEKSEITSLDLRFLSRELRKSLVNGMFRKIYQYKLPFEGKNSHQLLLEVFVPGRGEQWLYADRNKIFLTTYKKPSPAEPPSFCLFLRKHLNNRKIADVRQHGFDRILEIRTNENILIFELFSDGNVILCDNQYNIIMPLYIQKWKDRDVKPRIKYRFPPGRIDPFSVNFDYFRNFLKKSEKKLVAFLAGDVGFGPAYAKEVCLRSGIDDQTESGKIGLNEAIHLFKTIQSFEGMEIKPTVYGDFVSPFPLEGLKTPVKGEKANFSGALDEFFSEQEIQRVEKAEEAAKEEERERTERIIESQEEAMEKWTGRKEETRTKADLIYSHYGTVESILEAISRAKSSGLSWEEIKRRVSSEQTPEAEAVKEIRENEGKVVVELGGEEIELDFRKSLEENAEDYYEGSKQAKRKMEGVSNAMEEQKQRLDKEPEVSTESEKPVKIVKKRGKWFEKFRWFSSSDGFLIVAGKDQTSNETLIKKYTEPSDLVFHSDIQGAPFVVIKSGESDISEYAKKEAAEFAAAYSKAWGSGLATIDVYAVRPDQVSKQPPTGEYLPSGAFMIYGQREWFRDVELKISIGVRMDRENELFEVIAGPVMPIRKQTNYFVTAKPGNKEASELAREMKNKILIKATPEDKVWIEKVPLDEFQKFIPGGKGEIVEYGV
jgi:predicted ribosome quality control (RQC) complex YloA/Tae2 family protein